MVVFIIKKLVHFYYILFNRVNFQGKKIIEMSGPAIIAPLHISNNDAPLLVSEFARKKIYTMGKSELFKFKPFGWFLSCLGVYPVDRAKKDMGSIKNSLKYLKKGNLLCIFPEGTRNGLAKNKKLHNGVVYIAIAAKVPVIPVGISGKYGLFGKVNVKVGKPIYFDKYYEIPNIKEHIEEINGILLSEMLKLKK